MLTLKPTGQVLKGIGRSVNILYGNDKTVYATFITLRHLSVAKPYLSF